MNGINHQVGQRIRFYRKRLGLSAEALAQRVSMSRTHVLRIETGLTNPPILTLQRFADVLGVTVKDLFPNDTDPVDPDESLEVAFRGTGLTKEETEKVMEYARMLRLTRQHDQTEGHN